MVLAHNISEGLRTRDIQITQDVTFETMLLSSTTLQGLQESGFYKPSPVQLHGIPLGKCGFDLLLEAKSGTGKTAVFSVIALEKLDLSKGLQVVILAPTREIASQICDVIRQIGIKYEGLNVEVVMGGLPVEEDVNKFKKNVHVVVGSPGRLRHLVQDKYIDVSFVRLLVLDEADRLMEKSFLPDINFIFSILPHQKQVILSSATYTENTKVFIKKYVKSAQHVCPDSNCVLLGVEQKITLVKFNANIVRQTQNRFEELLKILSKKVFKQCLIFCNYQARVTEVHKLLSKHKWPVEQLYGQQDQTDRLGALKTLQEYKCRILIATDLAARGIDASNVDLVVNFEPPFEWQTYLHRIGRAGRFGSYGMSITILSEGKEERKFTDMLDLLKVPLNIESFWTSDKNYSNLTPQLKPQITSTKKYIINNSEDPKLQELWKQLTGDQHNVKNKEEKIENFEALCHSFEETKTGVVDSFDDLLESFQCKQVTEKPNEYQHLHITSKEIEKYSDSLRVLKETNSKLHRNCSMKVCNETEKCSNNVKKVINDHIHCDKDNSNHSILKKYFQTEAAERHIDVKKNIGSLPPLEEPYVCDKLEDTEELYPTTALMAAGLPVSFGHSKNKKKHISNSFTTNLKPHTAHGTEKQMERQIDVKKDIGSLPSLEEEPYVCDKIEELSSTTALMGGGLPVSLGHSKNKKKHISSCLTLSQAPHLAAGTEKQTKPNYHTNTTSKNDSSHTKRFCKEHRATKARNLNENDVSNNCLHHENGKSYHSHKEIEDSDSEGSDYGLDENYVNWFNQFKFRMQEIELALYIEEMSLL